MTNMEKNNVSLHDKFWFKTQNKHQVKSKQKTVDVDHRQANWQCHVLQGISGMNIFTSVNQQQLFFLNSDMLSEALCIGSY